MKTSWSKTKSLILSRILTCVFTVLIAAFTFFVPLFADWYNDISGGMGLISGSIYIPTMITLYICEAFALAAVIALHILLGNITAEKVFVSQNTACLRVISWACMLAGGAFCLLSLWRFMCILPAFFAVLFGLVMRVLKNVFEEAVEIKSENDFTI